MKLGRTDNLIDYLRLLDPVIPNSLTNIMVLSTPSVSKGSIMEKQYTIYVSYDLRNGKSYVGQTTKTGIKLERYIGSGNIITNIIKKYGKGLFWTDTICSIWTDKKFIIDALEKYWIDEFDSRTPNGYNIACGGQGGYLGDDLVKRSELVKEGKSKMSQYAKEKAIEHFKFTMDNKSLLEKEQIWLNRSKSRLGRITSDTTKQKMKTTKRKLYKRHSYHQLGRANSETQKAKVKEVCSKKVICVETGELYPSCTEAAKSVGVTKAMMSYYCRGKCGKNKEFHFQYFESVKE
jgi:hypothetical protein